MWIIHSFKKWNTLYPNVWYKRSILSHSLITPSQLLCHHYPSFPLLKKRQNHIGYICIIKSQSSELSLVITFIIMNYEPSTIVQWSIIWMKGQNITIIITAYNIFMSQLTTTWLYKKWSYNYHKSLTTNVLHKLMRIIPWCTILIPVVCRNNS